PYWLVEPRRDVAILPLDEPAGENTIASAAAVISMLSEEETRALLQEVPEVYRTQINDVLLAGLARVLADWTGSARVLVALEGHGGGEVAAELDVSRTVGWFTSLYPVLLDAGVTNPGRLLRSVKEQLRAVPQRGLGYGLLRYLGGDPDLSRALAELPQPQL